MCTTKLYKSKRCGHKWLVIDTPCGYGKGFSTCDTFNNQKTRAPRPRAYWASDDDDCPWHGLKGNYDFNRIRMIESIKYGYSICGPRETANPGVNFVCCTIM